MMINKLTPMDLATGDILDNLMNKVNELVEAYNNEHAVEKINEKIKKEKESNKERVINKKANKKDQDNKLLEFWSEYEQLITFYNKTYGTRYKANEREYANFSYWYKTYDLVDMRCAVLMVKFDSFWHDKMTPTILFRQEDRSKNPCDRIGGLINLRTGAVEATGVLTTYSKIRAWADAGKPVEGVKELMIALPMFGMDTELQTALTELRNKEDGSNGSN